MFNKANRIYFLNRAFFHYVLLFFLVASCKHIVTIPTSSLLRWSFTPNKMIVYSVDINKTELERFGDWNQDVHRKFDTSYISISGEIHFNINGDSLAKVSIVNYKTYHYDKDSFLIDSAIIRLRELYYLSGDGTIMNDKKQQLIPETNITKYFPIPDRAIKINDSWVKQIEFITMKSQLSLDTLSAELQLKYIGSKNIDGHKFIELSGYENNSLTGIWPFIDYVSWEIKSNYLFNDELGVFKMSKLFGNTTMKGINMANDTFEKIIIENATIQLKEIE